MERANPSLKRRRSWLEIGIAGCSLLASPVEAAAAWPSFGAVWESFGHTSHQDHHHPASDRLQAQHANHHGTKAAPAPAAIPSLRGSHQPSAASPSHGRRRRHGQQQPLASTPLLTVTDDSRPPPPAERALKVEIAVHGRHGDWEACSPATCTQTRLVFCETLESRIIVANDLCGDELPEAERACSAEDGAAVCGGGDGGEAASAAGSGRHETQGDGSAAAPTAAKSGDAQAKRDSDMSEKDALVHSPGPGHEKTKISAPAAAAGGGSRDEATREKKVPAASTPQTPSRDASTARTEATVTLAVEGAGSPGGKQREEGGKGDAAGGESDTNGAAAAAAAAAVAAEPQDRGSPKAKPWEAHQRGTSGKPSAKKDDAGSNPSSETPRQEPVQPILAEIGRSTSNSSRAEYRFWVVMAIGAGAVGSFMAVVVFAVGQYRKEQHRLRGIMALNDFPQDNYINPFARQASSDLQLTEDDRSAFKL